ncbi:hypothetical protein DL95DRAFT_488349 [Leptodontidium sp. 2 PMI_412]|nr:hypothetical protein DL95DRAFT_488349 [Leptodontidium sp. 2 PMI_412]
MAERLREIPRMKNIYSSANQVLGWLGPYPPDLPERRVAAVFDKAMEITLKTSQEERFDLVMRQQHPIQCEVSENFEEFTNDFFAIIALPWFSRVWIIQEAAAACNDPILALGRLFVPFDCLRCMYSLYAYRMEWWVRPNDTGLGPISEIRVWLQDPERGHRLFDNPVAPEDLEALEAGSMMNFARRLNLVLKMAARATFYSTVPHDMIYSVLSMTAAKLAKIPKELEPDYSKQFSDVCRSYARFIAENTGDLGFLWRFRHNDNARHFDRTQGKIPSWVPNFSNRAHMASLTSKIRAKPSFSADGRMMVLEGVQVDTISAVADHLTGQSNAATHFKTQACRIYELLEASAKIRGVSANVVLHDWLKPFENMVDRVYDQSESEVAVASLVFMSWVQSNAEEPCEIALAQGKDTDCHSPRVKLMIGNIRRSLVRDDFFLTARGNIWASRFGNDAVRESDILCMLSGAPTPAILRPNGTQFLYLNVAKQFAGPDFEDILNGVSVWEDTKVFSLA